MPTDLSLDTDDPRPAHYGDPAVEERLLAEAAGLIDVSDTEWVVVRGDHRVSFLQGMFTNDIARLRPGEGCRTAWLNAKARVQMLLDVLAADDHLLLRLPPACRASFVAGLDRFVIAEDVIFEAAPERLGIAVEGPAAAAIVATLTGLPLADIAPWAAPPGTLAHRALDVAGLETSVRLVSHSRTPAGGVELWVEPAEARALREALLVAGEAHGLAPVGGAALEVARLRAGTLVWEVDVDTESFLPELPMNDRVSFKKGCYLGQEPVARVHFRGRPNRQVAGLLFAPGSPLPPARAPLTHEGKDAGWITAGAFSHMLGRTVALAFVRLDYLAAGTLLDVAIDGEPVGAEVRPFPVALPEAESES